MTTAGSDHPAISVATVALPFAQSFAAKRGLLDHTGLSPQHQARVRESLSDDLKKLCDVVSTGLRVPEVSLAAKERAGDLGVDLCRQTWHQQPRFDPGRRAFHLEHVVPILVLRNAWLAASDPTAMVDEFDRMFRIAWILKDEDAELTRRGYRSKRDDPEAAYDEAGITLVACH